MPVWLLLALMALAVYRLTRLIVKDTFPPVLWVRDRLAGGWRPLTGPEKARYREPYPLDLPIAQHGDVTELYVVRASWSPYWLAELASCLWCASGWVAGAVTAGVDLTVGVPSPWLAGPAVWGAAAWMLSREK
jgi:hypothetical protein